MIVAGRRSRHFSSCWTTPIALMIAPRRGTVEVAGIE